jgi:hypothetical protein
MSGKTGLQVWHRDYFERIIRDEVEFYFVQEYMARNPSRWGSVDKGRGEH